MNLATVIVLLVVLGLVVVAIHFLRMGKGGCSCDSKPKDKNDNRCAGCSVECPFKH